MSGMSSIKKENSELGKDDEDLPEDFFDEFASAEFMDGLNVVDSWNDKRPKLLEEDLRDLLRTRKEEAARERGDDKDKKANDERRRNRSRSPQRRRSRDRNRRSQDRSGKRSPDRSATRRDIEKTARDIRRDKETKVKEYLAKRLASDVGPPGTELDDYFDEKKTRDRKRSSSPVRRRRSPSPRRRSPSPRRRSPRRRSPLCLSPLRRWRRSRTVSPLRERRRRRSTSRSHRSRSPRRSTSKPRGLHPDDLMYPFQPAPQTLMNMFPSGAPSYGSIPPMEAYAPPHQSQGYIPNPEGYYPPGGMPGPGPSYFQGPNYSYGGGMPPAPNPSPAPYYEQPGPGMVPPPRPVPPPPTGVMPQSVPPFAAAPHVNPPAAVAPPVITPVPQKLGIAAKPNDLDQLLEDGKISKEDYLKLKPKNRTSNPMDLKEKVNVLTRCHDAVTKLSKLHLPNRLIMNNLLMPTPQKAITHKFCSPLKRQPLITFNFTSAKSSALQAQNKQLVDSIISTIGLQQLVSKPIKKEPSRSKDASSQTMTAFCESCEIRHLTKCNDKSTSVDSDHFSTSVYTQVIEVELASSKSMFTHGGKNSESGSISLAHLTPAQLIVSQLAARAKKLEPPPPEISDSEQYTRRVANSHSYYGSPGSSTNHYQNNYRY